ncbi:MULTISPECIES: hypothetical protein [unclassified Streptomyces]|uniref:hypothetical protein n=1 Tax=unclassified Streptomyces TaxID=2593676 RepID=UPI0004C4D6AC|nr:MULTISPECIES: hypothetical protein [unclassified Streptomyces]KOV75393.1 hypothetical protein ADL02_34515 [Streptomyces sp. NRRL WC-3723]
MAEELKTRALIERLTAVEGLEHVLTRFVDTCARLCNGSIFETTTTHSTTPVIASGARRAR